MTPRAKQLLVVWVMALAFALGVLSFYFWRACG